MIDFASIEHEVVQKVQAREIIDKAKLIVFENVSTSSGITNEYSVKSFNFLGCLSSEDNLQMIFMQRSFAQVDAFSSGKIDNIIYDFLTFIISSSSFSLFD